MALQSHQEQWSCNKRLIRPYGLRSQSKPENLSADEYRIKNSLVMTSCLQAVLSRRRIFLRDSMRELLIHGFLRLVLILPSMERTP